MPKLPVVSGVEAVRAFKRLGYEEVKRKNPYVRLVAPDRQPISVPQHSTLKKGTLRNLLNAADVTVEEFRNAL